MRLSQLRDFIEIVEAGSIRGAARRRNVSQPVLTKALRALETDVGARLVNRTAQGIMLTPSGHALLARARAVHAQLEKARQEVAELAGDRSGSVAFGASASGLVLVRQALSGFREEYPSCYVRLVEGAPAALMPRLLDETLDFLVGPKPPAGLDNRVRTRPLFRLALAVAARRGHPLLGARSVSQLTAIPWILFSASGWSESLAGQFFEANGLSRPVSITHCESYWAAISLLAESDAVGLMPRQHLADKTLQNTLAEIPVMERLPDLVFNLYMRGNDAPTSAAQSMVTALSSAARTMMLEARGARRA